MTTASTVTILNQTVEIDSVDSVVVTAAVDDGTSTGTFVRSIRIFGEPNGTNGPPVLEVRIKSQTLANIELTTPTLTF
jgi:hypothetical protein